MNDTVRARANCLCGAIRIVAERVSKKLHACHCDMCRKWSGGPLLAVDCGTDVTLEGGDDVGVYDSSEWAERGFCRRCGSNLFYRIKASKQYIVPVGLFENLEGVVFEQQIFIDEKPAYYSFADQTGTMTGAEVFAMYAPQSQD